MRKSILVGALLAVSAVAGVFVLNRPQPKPVQIISGPAPAEAEAASPKTIEFLAPVATADPGFQDLAGAPQHFSDFKGKFLVVNLWATWCGPCIKEMPSLARLAKALPSDRFQVLAISLDRGGVEQVRTFWDKLALAPFVPFIDPTTRLGLILKAQGMPTTLILDREGREIGRIEGGAVWDSPEMIAKLSGLAG